jgi:maleate cis-trans isomerase
MLFPENGIMSNLTCLPDAHREVTENETLQALMEEARRRAVRLISLTVETFNCTSGMVVSGSHRKPDLGREMTIEAATLGGPFSVC